MTTTRIAPHPAHINTRMTAISQIDLGAATDTNLVRLHTELTNLLADTEGQPRCGTVRLRIAHHRAEVLKAQERRD